MSGRVERLAADFERANRITREHAGYALTYTRAEGWRIVFDDDPVLDAPLADEDVATVIHAPFGASA